VGLEFAPGFLAVNELLGLFAGRPAKAQAAYRAFVRDGLAAVSDTVTRL
jgi:hypothetical protein